VSIETIAYPDSPSNSTIAVAEALDVSVFHNEA
jgi:hypothetical protein